MTSSLRYKGALDEKKKEQVSTEDLTVVEKNNLIYLIDTTFHGS